MALRADAWNTSGFLDEVARKVDNLRSHCKAVGRDIETIERTLSFPIVIRDTEAAAREAFASLVAHNKAKDAGNVPVWLGPPSAIADSIRPFLGLGFSTIIVRMPAPYDRETIDRIREVQEALG